MRYGVSGRAPSIIAAGLAIVLAIAMQLLATEPAREATLPETMRSIQSL